MSSLQRSKVSEAIGWRLSLDCAEGGDRGLNSLSSQKIKPRVYKELVADPSGRVMKETSRHFFKNLFLLNNK